MKQEVWDKIINDDTLVSHVESSGCRRPVLINPMTADEIKLNEPIICLYEHGIEFVVIGLTGNTVEVKTDTDTTRTIFLDSCLTTSKAMSLFKSIRKDLNQVSPRGKKATGSSLKDLCASYIKTLPNGVTVEELDLYIKSIRPESRTPAFTVLSQIKKVFTLIKSENKRYTIK